MQKIDKLKCKESVAKSIYFFYKSDILLTNL